MSEPGIVPETSRERAAVADLRDHSGGRQTRAVAAELRAEMGFPVEPADGPVQTGEILAELRMAEVGSDVITLTARTADVTETPTVLPPAGDSAPTLR